MRTTKISWCHHTVNFWWGCTKVSRACQHCYAEALDRMHGPLFDNGRMHWGKDAPRWIKTESALADLKRIQKSAAKRGVVERVFINSMSDTFEDRRDLDDPRGALFTTIPECPDLRFLLLTKRPENILKLAPSEWSYAVPDNVWIGATVESEALASERVGHLLDVPASTRFLSCEPLVEQIDLLHVCFNGVDGNRMPGIHWIICGGESGKSHQPMDLGWARMMRDNCARAGVAFFMKQLGGHPDARTKIADFPEDLRVQQFPDERKEGAAA